MVAVHACMQIGLVPLAIRASEVADVLVDMLPAIDAILASAQPSVVLTTASVQSILKSSEAEARIAQRELIQTVLSHDIVHSALLEYCPAHLCKEGVSTAWPAVVTIEPGSKELAPDVTRVGEIDDPAITEYAISSSGLLSCVKVCECVCVCVCVCGFKQTAFPPGPVLLT